MTTEKVKETFMNDQLQAAVSQLIDKSLQAFESGATFLSDQIPDVVNQLLMWHMLSSGLQALAAVVLAIVFVVIDYKVFKYVWAKPRDRNWGDVFAAYTLGGTIVRLIWILPFVLFDLTWLKIWIAPKIFLIEYAASMVK